MYLDRLNSLPKNLLQEKFLEKIRKKFKKIQQGKGKKVVEDGEDTEYHLWI